MVFGVRVSVTFHLMFVHIILVRFRLLSDHLLGKSCSLGLPYVLFVFGNLYFCCCCCCFFVVFCFVLFRFGLEGVLWVQIAPGHCSLVTFAINGTLGYA